MGRGRTALLLRARAGIDLSAVLRTGPLQRLPIASSRSIRRPLRAGPPRGANGANATVNQVLHCFVLTLPLRTAPEEKRDIGAPRCLRLCGVRRESCWTAFSSSSSVR